MRKETVPVITAEDVAKGDAAATAQAKGTMTALARAQGVELEPKPHKHFYRKDGTCACGKVRKTR